MSLEIKGTLKHIGELEQVTEKFSKRIFTIDVQSGQYTNMVCLQLVNNKTDLLDNYAIGQEIRAHFDVRSREYQGKYYTELTAWGVAKEGEAVGKHPTPQSNTTIHQDAPNGGGENDPLPF